MNEIEKLKADLTDVTTKLGNTTKKISDLETENKTMKAKADSDFAEKVKVEETAFCDQLIKEEKMYPHEKDAHIVLLSDLRLNKKVMNFAEKETSNYDLLRAQLSGRKKLTDLKGEKAKKSEFAEGEDKKDKSPVQEAAEVIRQQMKS